MSLTVLLVEDDDVDAMAVRRMFRMVTDLDRIDIHRAGDGQLGLEVLAGLVENRAPNLIVLLDINMPRMNGHEFLTRQRQDPVLRGTPVFILTTSVDPEDVRLAYDRHVAGYFAKATDWPAGQSVGRFLCEYSETVVLPG